MWIDFYFLRVLLCYQPSMNLLWITSDFRRYSKPSCYVVNLHKFSNFVYPKWLSEKVTLLSFLGLLSRMLKFKGTSLFQILLHNYSLNCMASATLVPILFTKNNFWKCHRTCFVNKHFLLQYYSIFLELLSLWLMFNMVNISIVSITIIVIDLYY